MWRNAGIKSYARYSPERKGERLKHSRFWRIRVGDYRPIYEMEDEKKTVIVLFIGRRRDVYDQFSGLLDQTSAPASTTATHANPLFSEYSSCFREEGRTVDQRKTFILLIVLYAIGSIVIYILVRRS